MVNGTIDDLEGLIRRVWMGNVKRDVLASQRKVSYEADLVASFYHHLRTLIEEGKYDVRLALERNPQRHLRHKKKKGRNDLHIIPLKGRNIPSLIGFEFKCSYEISGRHLKGDIPKLQALLESGVKRGYLCVVDLERRTSRNGVDNGKVRDYIRRQEISEALKRSSFRLALGTGDEQSWSIMPFSRV